MHERPGSCTGGEERTTRGVIGYMHTVVRRGDRFERRVVVAVAAAQLMDFRTVDAKTI